MSTNQTPAQKPKWHQQFRETYAITKKQVDKLGLKLALVFLVTLAAILSLGFGLGSPLPFGALGLGVALLVTTFFFGKIAERAAYSSIAGQLGAAASVANAMPARRGWSTTPGVAVDRNQNLVHRVVGRPGIILIAEGERPQAIVAEQRKVHARFVPDIPIHEIYVGHGSVELTDLQKAIKKLPKALRPGAVTELRRKLNALPKMSMPIPKGPMPTGRRPKR